MKNFVRLIPTRWDLMVFSSQADFRVETGGGGARASSHSQLVLLTRDVFALFPRHCSEISSLTLKSEEFEELRPYGTF